MGHGCGTHRDSVPYEFMPSSDTSSSDTFSSGGDYGGGGSSGSWD